MKEAVRLDLKCKGQEQLNSLGSVFENFISKEILSNEKIIFSEEGDDMFGTY